jgi:hypothetical protein
MSKRAAGVGDGVGAGCPVVEVGFGGLELV